MRFDSTRLLLVSALVLMLATHALASSGGPPESNMSGDSSVLNGCNCHGSAAPGAASGPSTEVVVSVAGVPHAYEVGAAYELTIKVEHSSNTAGGFMLSSGGQGTFSWAEDQSVRPAVGSNDSASAGSTSDNISHDEATDPAIWLVTWTAPAEDGGALSFYLAGNSVDGGGSNDANDHWNLLSFVINSPSSTTAQSDLGTRVISVGDYNSLFVSEPDEAALEHERQLEIAEGVFVTGNALYFTSLLALLVGAILQKEILERKHGEGPEWLAKELAYPQGLRRALTSAVAFLVGLSWMAAGKSPYLYGCALFIGFWAAYGVYRTALAAKQEPKVMDIA
jgi:hypothetical protein